MDDESFIEQRTSSRKACILSWWKQLGQVKSIKNKQKQRQKKSIKICA